MTTLKCDNGPIEVITSVQRRRRWSAEEKRAMVEEAEKPGSSVSQVARKYGVNPSQLFNWRRLMREGALSAVRAGEEVVAASEVRQLRARIRELERLLGRKTLETEILREALEVAREKKLPLADALARKGGFPVKRMAEVLAVSRSNLYGRRKRGFGSCPRGSYHKAEDEFLRPMIREIVDERPTYGYPRTTALLNRRLRLLGRPRVNHKRVYRMMKSNGLLLERHGEGPARVHEGKIVTPRSNLRWCSDLFEILCWNGEAVRVGFVLDCCDREVISYVATTSGISGEMIRDLMTEAIEARFGRVDRLPHRIEWLSDNGPAYRARETRAFAASLGLVVCRTPVESPESNGMAEAFIKTFKRDDVALHRLDHPQVVLKQLPEWLRDYNENHPHRGLKMMSPREYRQSLTHLTECPVSWG
ncbi:MAG: IS3 family transposase [Desulfobacterota bacterium]|nr:IS3 family transposase [Thermodesulfobacteriota bacterium]